VEQGHLVKRPWLGPLFRRLLERLDALRGEYAGLPPVAEREHLLALADRVRLVQDFTRWVDLASGSRRLGHSTPVGGLVGTATYQAERETWQALLPYLLWGQEVHVGKSATKGDGWYEVRRDPCPSYST
jgi:CRISPR/Cas system endoribonuclease Cas6 (RAMP superfamily)